MPFKKCFLYVSITGIWYISLTVRSVHILICFWEMLYVVNYSSLKDCDAKTYFNKIFPPVFTNSESKSDKFVLLRTEKLSVWPVNLWERGEISDFINLSVIKWVKVEFFPLSWPQRADHRSKCEKKTKAELLLKEVGHHHSSNLQSSLWE